MAVRPLVKSIGKNTVIYGVGNVLSKLATFLLIPVYARYLSASEVGIIALLEMAEMILITLFPLGITGALWRWLPQKDHHEKKTIISTSFWGIQSVGLIILLLLIPNRRNLGDLLSLGEGGDLFFLIICFNVFLFTGGQFILWMYQYEQHPLKYLLLSVGQLVGILSVTLYLVVFLGKGIYGVLISKSLVLSLIFVISTAYVLKNALVLPNVSMVLRMLRFGLPFVITAFVTPILTFSDRYFLKLFVSLEQIGIYSIAYKFGMIINMLLVVPFQRSWFPAMFREGIEEESHLVYKDLLFYYALIGALMFLMITFFAQDIIRLIATSGYVSGAEYVPWIAFAYYINGFGSFFVAGAALKDRTILLGQAGLYAILSNLVLNYLLIKYFGTIGAAWATTISYLWLVILIYRASQKTVYVDWGWKRLMKLLGITLALLGFVTFMQTSFPSQRIIVAIFGLIAFIVATFITKTVGSREMDGIRSIIGQGKNG